MLQTEESRCNDLQVVLLGWHKAGKTSVVNTILGPSVAVAVSGQCVKKEGYVNGRKIALVDTPGWWKDLSIKDSPELSKQAIVRSVSLCPPGPQVFLLVIEADLLFTEKHMEPLMQRMELLSERVWEHTIILFTGQDSLLNVTIEQHIQSQGPPLQKLLKKCGNRYHVFDVINQENTTQVAELFEKIDNVVRQNGGKHFEINLKVHQEHQRKWEDVQTRASTRRSEVQKEKSIIAEKANIHRLEEVRIILFGWMISGKSSVGNKLLGHEEFLTGERTMKCKRAYGKMAGRKITVLDTPGWWKFFSSEFNPQWVKTAVLQDVLRCKKYPHAMLLVLPADTSFKEEQKKTIQENMDVFGEQIWRHTIVLFTWGDFLGDASIEQHIESEGEALQWLIDKCGNRYHVFDNTKSGDDSQVTELLDKVEEMVAGNCLFRPDVTALNILNADPLLEIDEESDVLDTLMTRWNRKVMDFKENIGKILTEPTRPMKSNQSRDSPPNFSEEQELCEMDSPPQKRRKRLATISKVSENLPEQLISLLEREFSRHEAMVMEIICALLRASRTKETSSEVSEEEIKASMKTVLWWFSHCEPSKEESRQK
ncbi:GTPase IMAP family member 8 [Hoplias malabaricus]|uniref:GTPase IMAP family member 8 n=1 Tax=Hoplias malabaricus TaxID=27720 RepID=UPI003461B8D7